MEEPKFINGGIISKGGLAIIHGGEPIMTLEQLKKMTEIAIKPKSKRTGANTTKKQAIFARKCAARTKEPEVQEPAKGRKDASWKCPCGTWNQVIATWCKLCGKPNPALPMKEKQAKKV